MTTEPLTDGRTGRNIVAYCIGLTHNQTIPEAMNHIREQRIAAIRAGEGDSEWYDMVLDCLRLGIPANYQAHPCSICRTYHRSDNRHPCE